jgi:hypothetical protein
VDLPAAGNKEPGPNDDEDGNNGLEESDPPEFGANENEDGFEDPVDAGAGAGADGVVEPEPGAKGNSGVVVEVAGAPGAVFGAPRLKGKSDFGVVAALLLLADAGSAKKEGVGAAGFAFEAEESERGGADASALVFVFNVVGLAGVAENRGTGGRSFLGASAAGALGTSVEAFLDAEDGALVAGGAKEKRGFGASVLSCFDGIPSVGTAGNDSDWAAAAAGALAFSGSFIL